MKPSYADIKFETIDVILQCTKDDLQGPTPYDEIEQEADTHLIVGCRSLGIPTVSFGDLKSPKVPDELAIQLQGRIFTPCLPVQLDGKQHLVVGAHLQPPRLPNEEPIDYIERFPPYNLEVGKLIPPDSEVLNIYLIPEDAIDLGTLPLKIGAPTAVLQDGD